VPATVDKKIHKTLQISMEITEQTGSLPTDEQLTQKLGITIDSLYEIYNCARAKSFLSIDSSKENSTGLGDLLTSNGTATPDKCLEKAELIDKLTEAVRQLSEKQRQVILLYYHQQLTMKQIAEIFKITEPRVSQLHASALFHLSIKLRQWKDETK
jgi:RNA polymerase sigma factor for flagellar operon FliA